ncbi:MAG: NrsF family protein [Thermoanaerobaculales bacterium]|jgi:hypothetical protein|nr:NrsF family protein [Thermoanaerobaculales bacterium]
MSHHPVPENLRQAVEDNLGPVRPLHPWWLRAMLAVAVAAVILAAVLATAGLRTDMEHLPMWLSWGSSGFQLALAFLLIALALRESVPGGGAPIGTVRTVAVVALTVQILVGVATALISPPSALPGDALSAGMGCFAHESAMAIPIFAVTLLLVFRALPLRAPTAGLLGGAGSTLGADAVIHLLCPKSDLAHVLVWHTGSVLFFMVLGWLAGVAWRRVRWQRGS